MTGRRRWSQAGQSTVEFAVLLPALLLAVLVVVQGGLVVRDQLLVHHAAREGARVAAVTDSIVDARAAATGAGPLDPDRMVVRRTERRAGHPVRVSVDYRFRGAVPIIGPMLDRFTLSASVTMRAE